VKSREKAKIVAKNLLQGKTKKDALLAAGYKKSTANTQVKRICDHPIVQSELHKLADKLGLTDNKLIKKHVELLDATKTVSTVSGKDAGAGTVDFVDVPDYQTQCKAVDMGYKVKGHYVERHEIGEAGEFSGIADRIRAAREKSREIAIAKRNRNTNQN